MDTRQSTTISRKTVTPAFKKGFKCSKENYGGLVNIHPLILNIF